MRNYLGIFLGLLCILVIVFFYSRTKLLTYQGEGFSLRYPKELNIEKKSPVEDFYIYTFKLGDKLILSAYVGNQPSLSLKDTKQVKFTDGQIDKLEYKSYQVQISDSVNDKEVLIKLSKDKWPVYIHFWYSKLNRSQAALADKIIFSVRKSQ